MNSSVDEKDSGYSEEYSEEDNNSNGIWVQ